MANELIPDGNDDFSGGQDAWMLPDRIKPNQIAKGINITTRRGGITPRPGYERLDLIFPEGGVTNKKGYFRTWENIFTQGKFQSLIPFVLGEGEYVIAIVSGYFFRISERLQTVMVLNETGPRPNQYRTRVNWSFAGKYLVVFDFPDYPIIIDGSEVRRANPDRVIDGNPAPEVPVSNIGAFNQDRLFVGNAGNEFTGGDPVGTTLVDPPITFAEVLAPTAVYPGQVFSLGTQYYNLPITFMGFLQQTDSTTGIGPFVVATKNSIYTFKTDLPRSQWQTGPFGSSFVYSAGIVGPRAAVNLNSDFFFLSADAQIRSASMSRDEQGRWSKVPISREVQNWLKVWDPELLSAGFMSYFDNRIFCGANPIRVPALDIDQNQISDVAHAGMVALEFDNLATLGNSGSAPSWAGVWTGIKVMDMALSPANDRAFMFARGAQGNGLYELKTDRTYDFEDGRKKYINSRIYTKEYDFRNRFSLKEEYSLSLGLKNIQGDLSVQVDRKPSHASNYSLYRLWKYKAPYQECDGIPQYPNGLAPHNFKEVRFGDATDSEACSISNNDLVRFFRKTQLRITISAANWRLEDLLIMARDRPELSNNESCDSIEKVNVPVQCDDDWLIGEMEDTCQVKET